MDPNPDIQSQIQTLKKRAAAISLSITPQMAAYFINLIKEHGISSPRISKQISFMFHSPQNRNKIKKILDQQYSSKEPIQLVFKTLKSLTEDNIKNALNKFSNYLSDNFKMSPQEVFDFLNDVVMSNNYQLLENKLKSDEKISQKQFVKTLVDNCFTLVSQSSYHQNVDPGSIIIDKMCQIVQQWRKNNPNKIDDDLKIQESLNKLSSLSKRSSHDFWKSKNADKNKKIDPEMNKIFLNQPMKQKMIKSFQLKQKVKHLVDESESQQFRNYKHNFKEAKDYQFDDRSRYGNQKFGKKLYQEKQIPDKNFSITFCFVSNVIIHHYQIKIFHQYTQDKRVDLSRQSQMAKRFESNGVNYYVINVTSPISPYSTSQNFLFEVAFIKMITFKTAKIVGYKIMEAKCELYKNKGFAVLQATNILDQQRNCAVVCTINGISEILGMGNQLHKYSDFRAYETLLSRQMDPDEQNISQFFDWLHILSKKIQIQILRQQKDIANFISLIPQQSSKSSKYFIFLMKYLFDQKTEAILSACVRKLDFPTQYRRRYTLNAYHQYLQNQYLLTGMRLLFSKMQNVRQQFQYMNSALTFMNANMQYQLPEIKKSLILETLTRFPFLLGQSYMVNDFLRNSEIISPMQYFNLATHYTRVSSVNSENSPNEIENSNSIIRLLEGILNKFSSMKYKIKKTNSISQSIRSLSNKSSTGKIQQFQGGIKLMFVLSYHYLVNGPFLALQGEYLVKALKILRKLEKQCEIPQIIYQQTCKYFDQAVYLCLRTNPSDIVPILCLAPVHERELNYLKNYFEKQGVEWPIEIFKTIFSKIFVYKNQSDPFDLKLALNNAEIVVNKNKYDTLQFMEQLNDTLRNCALSEEKQLFVDFFKKALEKTEFKKAQYITHTNESFLKILKLQTSIRTSTLIKFCAFLKDQLSNLKRDYILAQLSQQQIQQNDLNTIIKHLYLNEQIIEENQERQILEAFKTEPKLIKAYQKKYERLNYQVILQKLCNKIERQDLLKEEFQKILRNSSLINYHVKDYCNFSQKITQLKKKIDILLLKLDNTLKILRFHQQNANFQLQISEINDYNIRIQTQILREQMKIPQKYLDMFESSQEISVLIKLQVWNREKVRLLNDILLVRDETVKKLKLSIKNFLERKILFEEFHFMFPEQYIQNILQYNDDEHLKSEIRVARKKTNLVWLQQFHHYALSFDFIKNRIQNKVFQFDQFYEMIKSLHSKKWDLNIQDMLRIIDFTNKIFIQHGISVCDPKDEIGRTIFRSGPCKQMFSYIEEKNLDYKTIGDLKQYINDLENSILRLQTVKDFESVVLYWQSVMESKSIKQLLISLKNEIQSKKWILSESILNCFNNLKLIEQKIDESINRETSFKYQIEKIFKYSRFLMKTKEENIDIKIIILTDDPSILTKTQLTQDEKRILMHNTIQYKKLVLYKEKSILLINDFQREKTNLDEKTENIIKVLKQYFELFKVIEEIQKGAEILIKYGYDPNSIHKEGYINNHNYQSIQQISKNIVESSKEWKQQMRKYHQKSFLLTHFLGPQLNFFIEEILNAKYHPSLEWIIGMDKQKFEKHIKLIQQQGILKNAQKLEPLQRIKLVDLIFQNYRFFPKRSQQNQIKQPTLTLITCRQSEFYFALFDGNTKPQINQILYCQIQTKPIEIQVFLNRARLNPGKKHFILAVHNLNVDLQLYFCQLMNKYFLDQKIHNGARLCFIDYKTNQKIFLHICRPNLFQIQKVVLNEVELKRRSKLICEQSGNTYVIDSLKPGMGKTFKSTKLAKQHGKTHLVDGQEGKITLFPIAGNVSFTSISKRLSKLTLKSNDTLLLQIGSIQNRKKAEVFLYEIIMFRCFNYRKFMFFPQKLQVILEIENIYDTRNQDQYHIIKFLKEHGKHIHISEFNIQQVEIQETNTKDIFVAQFLQWYGSGAIVKRQLKYNPNITIVVIPRYKEVLKLQFYQKITVVFKANPTFAILRKWMDMLFQIFYTFSQTYEFGIQMLKNLNMAYPGLGFERFRLRFIEICINNCLQFLIETITTNSFDVQQTDQQDFRKKLANFPLLVLPSKNRTQYQFVYLKHQQVPKQIKSFLISAQYRYANQLVRARGNIAIINKIFENKSLTCLNEKKLQEQIFNMLYVLSGNQKLRGSIQQIKKNIPNISRYKLTLDNFFKMCLIYQRSLAGIPIVIMGQSGVGKTALINFLVKEILEEQLHCLNIHAGVGQPQLDKWVQTFRQRCDAVGQNTKIWAFFDEFNTTDQLSFIRQMIIDKRYKGQPLPKNLILAAVCNPYRVRQVKKTVKAGIKKEQSVSSSLNLAFTVKPPPLSMVQFMWDYQQLQAKQNNLYISKILEDVQYQEQQKLVKAIVQTHEFLKKNVQISAVSLRDVSRFRELFHWFLENMPTQPPNLSLATIAQNRKDRDFNYKLSRRLRAIILAMSFGYSLRLATLQQRSKYFRFIQQIMGFDPEFMNKVTKNEQLDYVNRLVSPGTKIALNFALRENVFTTLVCLMNKIPILIIGNPGSSKSLSIKMIASNFRGVNSISQFCKGFPEINMIFFQGSESCTSKGIEAVFQKAIRSKEEFQSKQKQSKYKLENCILFDQIGLAEKSVHNPLKVLHSKLQTNKKQIGFIGISNWQLDAAKMSRFLILARSTPDLQQLKETSVQIYKSYFPSGVQQDYTYFNQLAKYYSDFLKQWDGNLNNRQGFFGLRDFYSYIKYVCEIIGKEGSDYEVRQRATAKSIQINFDGQPGSVDIFNQIARVNTRQKKLTPVQIVEQNIKGKQSRCLLLIVKGDALIPIINQSIRKNHNGKRVICIYGSTFKDDQESQEYNLDVTSMIISHISRGNILAFKDINNSIQTSLYDLFNKSFYEVGQKKYCRIAVGANSNPKCYVHHQFNSMVYIDQSKIKHTDLAFLNRFEKHFLNIQSMIYPEEKQVVKKIIYWIESILKFRDNSSPLKRENYILNSCQQSIVTLAIKFRNSSTIEKDIKKTLLQNRTTDFYIALMEDKIEQQLKEEINTLLEDEKDLKDIKQDIIIYTYDQFLEMSETYILWNDKCKKLRISQIKRQRDLRKQIEYFFQSSEGQSLHIHINFQNESQHVNLILYLVTSLKQFYGSTKRVVIIIQLHRFSLIALGIDQINISYLHNFQQFFSQDLTAETETKKMLEIKKMDKMFAELKLKDDYNQLILQSIKRFQFTSKYNETQPQLRECYFYETAKISKHPLFQSKCLQFVVRHLKQYNINYAVLLQLKEDILVCSNIKQAISKYMRETIINILCHFLYRVLENNLVYLFNPKSILEYYVDYQNLSFLEAYIQKVNDFHNKLLEKIFIQNVFHANIDRQKAFNKGISSNPIEIHLPTILPLSFKDILLVFAENLQSVNQADSVQFYASKLFKLALSSQSKDQGRYKMNLNKAKNLINEKTRFNSNLTNFEYQYWPLISNDKTLEIGYLFDMLQYLFFHEELKYQMVIKSVQFMQLVFSKLTLQNKLISITTNRKLWTSLFKLLIIIWEHEEDQKKINQFLRNNFENETKVQSNLVEQIIRLANTVIHLASTMLSLKQKSVNYYGINKYIQFFKQIASPIRQLVTSNSQYGITVDQQFKVSMKLVQLLEKINKKQLCELIINFTKQISQNQHDSLLKKIFKYIAKLLEKQQDPKNEEIILNYLSFQIFPYWLMSQKASNKTEYLECIQFFIQYSNKYSYFANNSVFFLQNLLSDYLEATGYQQKLQKIYLLKNSQDQFKLIEQNITFENNFSVAVGNFLSIKLKLDLEEVLNPQTIQETSFLQQFFDKFNKQLNSTTNSKAEELFQIQFCKLYLAEYANELIHKKTTYIMRAIDSLLDQQSSLLLHLRIFIMKYLYLHFKDITILKTEYYDKNVCRWIRKCYDLLEESEVQPCLLPPSLDKASQIRRLIKQLRQSIYIDSVIFEKILDQSMKSQDQMYEFLNFIMIDFYTRTVPANLIQFYQDKFLSRQIFNSPQYYLEKMLVLRYINHQINNRFKYEQQTTTKQFMEKQLPYLNLLNMIAAQRKNAFPLLEMFFTKEGGIPQNLYTWISERFIIGGRQNNFVSILETFIDRNDQGPGYYKCSSVCDYIYSVGGGSLGCQNVFAIGICPICGKEIGGRVHGVLQRAAQGAKKVFLEEFPAICNKIREKKSITIMDKEKILFGYTNGSTISQLKECDMQNNRVNSFAKKFLNMIVFMMWYFLSQFKLISAQDFNSLFRKGGKQGTQFLWKAFQYYSYSARDFSEIKNPDQYLIWLLGVSRQVFFMINKYRSNLKANEVQNISLKLCQHRDKCEKYISNNLIKLTGGKPKEKLILQSRENREGFTMTKQDFIKQIGDFRIHTIQYKKMRMFKGLQQRKRPSYRNLINQYGQSLALDHPTFAFISDNQMALKKCHRFKIIYAFISKIIKACQFKFTRPYSNVTQLKAFLNENFTHEPTIMQEQKQFINAWNQLAQSQFQLRQGCHSLGFLEKVTPQYALRTFLPDSKHKDNVAASKLKGLYESSVGQYNDLCKQFDNSIAKLRKNSGHTSIISTSVLNPTQVTIKSKMLQFPQQLIQNIVKKYSSFSVQYGMSTPHYAIDQIQSLIIKHFQGCKALLTNDLQYLSVNYIGELYDCISDIRENFNQTTLEKINTKEIINDFIVKLYTKNRDIFYKTIKSIQGSLEVVMLYYKNSKPNKTILINFIDENKINGLCKQITEEPFTTLPMSVIVDLYQSLEMCLYDQLQSLLDPTYKSNDLSHQQHQKLTNLIQRMVQNDKLNNNAQHINSIPSFWDLRIAFYRFVNRNLLFVACGPEIKLGSWILYAQQFYPIQYDIYQLTDAVLKQTLDITLSKTSKIMKLIPAPKIQEMVNSKQRLILEEHIVSQAKKQRTEQKSRATLQIDEIIPMMVTKVLSKKTKIQF